MRTILLLLDGEMRLGNELRVAVTQLGFDVRVVHDVDAALVAARKATPEIVIASASLASSLVERRTRFPKLAAAPIVRVTSTTTLEDLTREVERLSPSSVGTPRAPERTLVEPEELLDVEEVEISTDPREVTLASATPTLKPKRPSTIPSRASNKAPATKRPSNRAGRTDAARAALEKKVAILSADKDLAAKRAEDWRLRAGRAESKVSTLDATLAQVRTDLAREKREHEKTIADAEEALSLASRAADDEVTIANVGRAEVERKLAAVELELAEQARLHTNELVKRAVERSRLTKAAEQEFAEKLAAEAAKVAAEAAKLAAETAKLDAMSAKFDAETAKLVAETAKLDAATAKVAAEAAKVVAEEERRRAVERERDLLRARKEELEGLLLLETERHAAVRAAREADARALEEQSARAVQAEHAQGAALRASEESHQREIRVMLESAARTEARLAEELGRGRRTAQEEVARVRAELEAAHQRQLESIDLEHEVETTKLRQQLDRAFARYDALAETHEERARALDASERGRRVAEGALSALSQGAEARASELAKQEARFRGELSAARDTLISVEREHRAELDRAEERIATLMNELEQTRSRPASAAPGPKVASNGRRGRLPSAASGTMRTPAAQQLDRRASPKPRRSVPPASPVFLVVAAHKVVQYCELALADTVATVVHCDLVRIAATVEEKRPLAIVLSEDIFVFDEESLLALARTVDAAIIVADPNGSLTPLGDDLRTVLARFESSGQRAAL